MPGMPDYQSSPVCSGNWKVVGSDFTRGDQNTFFTFLGLEHDKNWGYKEGSAGAIITVVPSAAVF